jgi:hypothetical protein
VTPTTTHLNVDDTLQRVLALRLRRREPLAVERDQVARRHGVLFEQREVRVECCFNSHHHGGGRGVRR